MKYRYPQEFYNVVAFLCLLECLFRPPLMLPPTGYSLFHKPRFRSLSVENYYKESLPFPDSIELSAPVPAESSKFWQWSYSGGKNIVNVLIYTDIGPPHHQSPVSGPLRSFEAANFSLNANGRRNELSLEDIDLIDCLWRQDIDAEKGQYASIQSPENQHESDLLVLNEKYMLQPNRRQLSSVVDDRMMIDSQYNELRSDSLLKSFEDIFTGRAGESDKFDFAWFNNNTNSDISGTEKFHEEKRLNFGAEKFLGLDDAHFDGSEGGVDRLSLSVNDSSSLRTPENTAKDFCPKNITASSLSNDTDFNELYNPLPNFEFLNNANMTDWDAPCTSASLYNPSFIDLSASTALDSSYMSNFPWSCPPYAAAATSTVDETVSLVTPSLDFSSNELVQLFTDRQVIDDVVEACQSKASLIPTTSTAPVAEIARTYTPDFDISVGTQQSYYRPPADSNSINANYFNDDEYKLPVVHRRSSRNEVAHGTVVPSTSFGENEDPSGNLVISSHDEEGTSAYDRSSSIAHDHQYCAFGDDGIVEIEVQSSISSCSEDSGEGKIMPRRISESSGAHYKPLEFMYTASDRDEQLAKKCNLGVLANEIINMPVTRYQKLLRDPSYTDVQKEACRKIRRRGRNKFAAQSCRQRRVNNMQQLEAEVNQLEQEYWALMNHNEQLEMQIEEEKKALRRLGRKKFIKKEAEHSS